MPHQCTNCGRTFPDGSKEMLSGCPDCGGNKFQFTPSGSGSGTSSGSGSAAAGSSDAAAGSASASSAADGPGSGSGPNPDPEPEPDESMTSRAAETVRDLMSPDSSSASDSPSTPNAGAESETETETDEPASDRSWPATATEAARGGDDAPDETEEFTAWPDTARRPEDRDGNGAPTQADAESDDSTADRRKPTATLADSENTAQADARSDVVSSTELPSHTDRDDLRNRTASQPADSSANAVESGSGTADTGEPDASVDATASAESASVSGSETDSAVESAVNDPTDGDAVADADPTGDDQPPSHGRVVSEPSGDEPSIEDLREELNKQFESIKIVRPGQYELNLMELYNREEYIISLQEDGRYVIDVPDSWREGDE